MNKQRLLELAGLSTNMSNPSFEPAVDVQDNKLEPPAYSTPYEEDEEHIAITFRDDPILDQKLMKMYEVDENQVYKLVWNWVKQNAINARQFQRLMQEYHR